MKEQFSSWVKEIQNSICHEVEKADGKEKFLEDKWTRPEGGGGITRVIQNGAVFEKGGVNTSEVYGDITPAISAQLKLGPQTPQGGLNSLLTPTLSKGEGGEAPLGGLGAGAFYACGISLVLHPRSPMVPTVHANYRYFEVYDKDGNILDSWFGGGADLTPYYLFEEDAVHFHKVHKASCDKFREGSYQVFKKQCDDYFVNTHRGNERRGIGGIFYDHMKPSTVLAPSPRPTDSSGRALERAGGEVELFEFAQSNGKAFTDAYFPIVEKRKKLPFTEAQKHWQLIRRGRYVEFNLIHDRGTIFGLKSNGRTESILMSLPPEVRFEYDYRPKANSEEEKLQNILLNPKDWI